MSNLRDVLLEIRAKYGYINSEVVLQEARDEAHPFHSRFEWDDSVAGERYRRQQAHELIQSYRIKYKEADGRHPARYVRGFHAVPSSDSPSGFVYDPAEEIAADPLRRSLVLQAMEREWRTLKARYGAFAEFAEMIRRDLGDEAA